MGSKLSKTVSRFINMKVVAIIPARGGSKGIFKKNLVKVLGKPLIDWTIEAALSSSFITDVVVTSDDDDILSNTKKFEDVLLIDRPNELAQDNSRTEPVLAHALEFLKNKGKEYDYLVLLQPTSPLRNSNDIDAAFKVLQNSEATSLISVVEPEHHPLKSFKINDKGFLEGLVNNNFPFMPRQELPKIFQPNGAIYIVKITEFLKKNTLFTNKTINFTMSPSKSIDIDTFEDIKRIENHLKL